MTGAQDPNHTATHRCYAHFPTTGPKGEVCEGCVHIHIVGENLAVCLKHAELMGFKVKKRWPHNRGIDRRSPACKYFEPKGPMI